MNVASYQHTNQRLNLSTYECAYLRPNKRMNLYTCEPTYLRTYELSYARRYESRKVLMWKSRSV